jgi:hypothetical protein
MPAFPSKEQIEYVGSQAAMLAVEHTAGQREALERLAHDWFPDHDAVDRREIGRRLAQELLKMQGRLQARLERLEQTGKARCPR